MPGSNFYTTFEFKSLGLSSILTEFRAVASEINAQSKSLGTIKFAGMEAALPVLNEIRTSVASISAQMGEMASASAPAAASIERVGAAATSAAASTSRLRTEGASAFGSMTAGATAAASGMTRVAEGAVAAVAGIARFGAASVSAFAEATAGAARFAATLAGEVVAAAGAATAAITKVGLLAASPFTGMKGLAMAGAPLTASIFSQFVNPGDIAILGAAAGTYLAMNLQKSAAEAVAKSWTPGMTQDTINTMQKQVISNSVGMAGKSIYTPTAYGQAQAEYAGMGGPISSVTPQLLTTWSNYAQAMNVKDIGTAIQDLYSQNLVWYKGSAEAFSQAATQKTADMNAILVAQTKLKGEDVGPLMRSFAPVAQAYGMSQGMAEATAGSLAQMGLEPSQAGNMARRLLLRFTPNVTDLQKLDAYQQGITNDKGQVIDQDTGKAINMSNVDKAMAQIGLTWKDVDASAIGLPAVISKIGDAMKAANFTPLQTEAWMKTVTGLQGITGMSMLKNPEFYNSLLDSIMHASDGIGATAAQAKIQTDNLWGSLEMLKSGLVGLGDNIGFLTNSPVKSFVDFLRGPALQGIQSFGEAISKGDWKGAATIAGNAFSFFGQKATEAFSVLKDDLTNKDTWNTFGDIAKGALTSTQDILLGLSDSFASFATGGGISGGLSFMKDWVTNVLSGLDMTKLSQIGDNIWTGFKSGATEAIGWLADNIPWGQVAGGLTDAITGSIYKIGSFIEGLPWDKITRALDSVFSTVADHLGGWIAGQKWDVIGTKVGEGLGTATGMISSWFSKELGKVTWSDVGVKVKSAVDAIGSGAFIGLQTAGIVCFNAIGSAAATAGNAIAIAIQNGVNGAIEALIQLTDAGLTAMAALPGGAALVHGIVNAVAGSEENPNVSPKADVTKAIVPKAGGGLSLFGGAITTQPASDYLSGNFGSTNPIGPAGSNAWITTGNKWDQASGGGFNIGTWFDQNLPGLSAVFGRNPNVPTQFPEAQRPSAGVDVQNAGGVGSLTSQQPQAPIYRMNQDKSFSPVSGFPAGTSGNFSEKDLLSTLNGSPAWKEISDMAGGASSYYRTQGLNDAGINRDYQSAVTKSIESAVKVDNVVSQMQAKDFAQRNPMYAASQQGSYGSFGTTSNPMNVKVATAQTGLGGVQAQGSGLWGLPTKEEANQAINEHLTDKMGQEYDSFNNGVVKPIVSALGSSRIKSEISQPSTLKFNSGESVPVATAPPAQNAPSGEASSPSQPASTVSTPTTSTISPENTQLQNDIARWNTYMRGREKDTTNWKPFSWTDTPLPKDPNLPEINANTKSGTDFLKDFLPKIANPLDLLAQLAQIPPETPGGGAGGPGGAAGAAGAGAGGAGGPAAVQAAGAGQVNSPYYLSYLGDTIGYQEGMKMEGTRRLEAALVNAVAGTTAIGTIGGKVPGATQYNADEAYTWAQGQGYSSVQMERIQKTLASQGFTVSVTPELNQSALDSSKQDIAKSPATLPVNPETQAYSPPTLDPLSTTVNLVTEPWNKPNLGEIYVPVITYNAGGYTGGGSNKGGVNVTSTPYISPSPMSNYFFAEGLDRVPYDEFPAFLHKDEMILTKEESAFIRPLLKSKSGFARAESGAYTQNAQGFMFVDPHEVVSPEQKLQESIAKGIQISGGGTGETHVHIGSLDLRGAIVTGFDGVDSLTEAVAVSLEERLNRK